MKKVLHITLLFLGFIVQAQSPKLNVKGKDSSLVRMNRLKVTVKVVGNIAYTTSEMHFFNGTNRQMEAELLFPLPEGVSVSRYAIDINGKMREAVPVNKNKGKQVFEAIEHRRVDPGLLEKVEGNNFRTRIYPLLPNKERIVIIGYEQELFSYDATHLAYQMISNYPSKLDVFEVNVSVLGANSQPSVIDNDGVLALENNNQMYQTSIKKENYLPKNKLLITIPIRAEIPNVVVQNVDNQYYFYANTILDKPKILKKNPNSIGLIWDISLSCKSRNIKKEFLLLDAYLKKIKNVDVTLYFAGYNFEKKNVYSIKNGNWSDLKSILESTIYDGGTRFSKIKLPSHDEYLFFTDGLSSLSSNNISTTKKPIYTITSVVSADYAFLNYNAIKTGGNFINLNQLNEEDSLDKLLFQRLKFLGVKENYLVTEMYPMVGTPVSGSFSVSGISLKANNEIVFLFGYDDQPILEKKITIDGLNQSTSEVSIEKLWAQKKIANLEIQYKLNADEIENLGKRFGIVTQNTSLIVLENLHDYIQYDIVPPAELRPEFDRLMKQQIANAKAKKYSNWENVASYYEQLKTWWDKNTKYNVPKPKPILKTPKKVTEINRDFRDGDRETEKELVVERSQKRETTSAMQVVESQEISASPSANVTRALAGKVAGVNVETKSDKNSGNVVMRGMSSLSNDETKDAAEESISEDNNSDNLRKIEDIKVTQWNPDRIYLKALANAPSDKKYGVYLQLRDDQINNPSFYFDVANHFYAAGNKEKALLILSNIADLGLENHQLYKSLTYLLRQWEAYDDALFTANQVAIWRAQEPQAHRDLGLTLEDNKKYQAAFDELIKALEVNYFAEMSGQYEGVEDIILMDINRMLTEHKSINSEKLDKKYLNKMPIDVRIILNWNQMDTDIDLHVIEPTSEECYYGHRDTEIGARFSKDFTQGYGPEQYLLRNAVKGKYIIKTNFFGESALTENGPTTVMVEIYTTKNGKTERTLQTIQLGTVRENQNLAEITID